MKKSAAARLSVRLTAARAIALLSNPRFRADAIAVHTPRAFWAVDGDPSELAAEAWTRTRQSFKDKHGVPLPPMALLDPDDRLIEAQALVSGRWGLVRVFASTTEDEVVREFKRIRNVIGRAKRDPRVARLKTLVAWLHEGGFSDSELAVAVWERTSGLKRPSRTQAARSGKANAVIKALLDEGLDYQTANRRATAAARGHEAPAAGMVRQARVRHEKFLGQQRAAREAPPLEADALSACLLKIIHLKFPTSPVPCVAPIDAISKEIDPLIDQLRKLLLTPPRA